MTATAQTGVAVSYSVLSLLICLIPKAAIFSSQVPKAQYTTPLASLLSDLGPSGFFHLFSSSVHISSPSYSLPWCFSQRGFFSRPPPLLCFYCWQVSYLSVDYAIPFLPLPCSFFFLSPTLFSPAPPVHEAEASCPVSFSSLWLSPQLTFPHPSFLSSSIFCLYPITSISPNFPSFVVRPS